MVNIKFYHRPGCWLCDKAEEMLNGLVERYGINMTRINIDTDDELYRLSDVNRRYSLKVIGLYKTNLAAADATILELRRRLIPTWYQQNKVAIWVSVAVMLTIGLAGLTGWGWREIQK